MTYANCTKETEAMTGIWTPMGEIFCIDCLDEKQKKNLANVNYFHSTHEPKDYEGITQCMRCDKPIVLPLDLTREANLFYRSRDEKIAEHCAMWWKADLGSAVAFWNNKYGYVLAKSHEGKSEHFDLCGFINEEPQNRCIMEDVSDDRRILSSIQRMLATINFLEAK